MDDRKINSAVITGPTGAIGTALCCNLVQRGIETYAICRPNSSRVAALPRNDLRQRRAIEA